MTYLHLPPQVAMSVGLGQFTAEMTPAEMRWWVDTCKELGLSKANVPLAEMLAPMSGG